MTSKLPYVTSSTYQADGDGSHAAVDDVGGHGDLVGAGLGHGDAAGALQGVESLQ